MSWKWEMDDHGRWVTNALRFATKDEAERYGADLGMRWLAMPWPARAAEADEPVNYRLTDDNVLENAGG